MALRLAVSLGAVLCLALPAMAQESANVTETSRVAAEVKRLVDHEFYRSVQFPALGPNATEAAIDKALADLKASHTRRIRPGTQDYYEIADIFRRSVASGLRDQLGPDGTFRYAGIGIATTVIDGKTFVSDVYDTGIAKTVGILPGDEIISVDGKSFHEIESFKGRAGQTVTVRIRRKAADAPIDIPVTVTWISAVETFLQSIVASARVIEQDGKSLGYVKLWTLASRHTDERLEAMLDNGVLAEIDGLILDLRGRWGGLSSEVPDFLLTEAPQVTFTNRNGRTFGQNQNWRKPIVVLIDEGTRSANEILGCALKKRGYTLVGKRSAGAVLGSAAYVLPDDSLLLLATSIPEVDGERLEAKGVAPDIEVSLNLPYSAGADPQLDEAIEKLAGQTREASYQPKYDPERKCAPAAASSN